MSIYPWSKQKSPKSGMNFYCENSETFMSVGKCGTCCITAIHAVFFSGPMWAWPLSIETFHFCTGVHKLKESWNNHIHQYFCIWLQMFFLQESGTYHYRTSWSSSVCGFLRLIYECVIRQLTGKWLCPNRLQTGVKGLQGAQEVFLLECSQWGEERAEHDRRKIYWNL